MTRTLNGMDLARQVREHLPDAVQESSDTAVWINPKSILEVARFLKDEPGLMFNYLNSITGVDYIDHFQVVYLLTSLEYNHSAMLKVSIYGRDEPMVPSVVDVWKGADLQEREVWDLMGIRFGGHPNLKRIMLWDGFPGHPLRKDFQETRGA